MTPFPGASAPLSTLIRGEIVRTPSSFEPLPAADGELSRATRSGGTVKRAAGPGTGAVHALLRHLEDTGFTGAPRVVGTGLDDEGNEVLTYVEGTVVHQRTLSGEAVWQAGRLLGDLHTATASFRPPPELRWRSWWSHQEGPGSVIGHCDAGPWHTVVRDGLPVAFIDWTLAGPVDRLDEVVSTAWWHAQLHDDDVAARNDLPDAATRARWLIGMNMYFVHHTMT
jgi:aminoglycoside phosphotransferase (APT) family kinase protein